MRSYKSIDEFNIIGRGKVFATESIDEGEGLLNSVVLIDGGEYFVRGVESMGKIKEGSPIGILVRDKNIE